MESKAGWYCVRVCGTYVCMPFDEYMRKGWDIKATVHYKEAFPSCKNEVMLSVIK